MRYFFVALSFLLAAATSFLSEEIRGWALAASLLLFLPSLATRIRPSIGLIYLGALVIFLTAHPDGLAALFARVGMNARSVFRDHGIVITLLVIAVVLAGFAVMVMRRGPDVRSGLLNAADDLERWTMGVGKLGAFLFVPLMLVILYDVGQRKIIEYQSAFIDSVFYLSSTKLQELEWHLHAVLFMAALGFAYARDAHVRIELVRDTLGPRTRAWIEIFGILLFLIPYCIVVARFGFTFAERAWISNEASAAQTGLAHRWIIKAVLPFGFIVLGTTGVAVLIRNCVFLSGGPARHVDPPDSRSGGAGTGRMTTPVSGS